MFQSSPALSSGRYCTVTPPLTLVTGFNPRPLFRAGATRPRKETDAQKNVSILARSFERALQAPFRAKASFTAFQSSPALSSGRYAESLEVGGMTVDVSILARSFERALPHYLTEA